MGRETLNQSSTHEQTNQGAPNVDFEEEHDEVRARRTSSAALRRQTSEWSTAQHPLAPPVSEPRLMDPEVSGPFAKSGPQCVAPPKALNWSTTPALAACPSEPMKGAPRYREQYDDAAAQLHAGLDTHKVAFNSSWSEAQRSYNTLVALHEGYKVREKDVIPLLRLDPSSGVGAAAANVNATKSFDGGKLKSGLMKIDSNKIPPQMRAQILAAQEKIKAAERAVENKRDAVANACGQFRIANNNLLIAVDAIEIKEADRDIANLQLDKEQVRRDLEQYKANIKATVESAKLITSIISCWADPTKLISNVLGAVNQAATTTGAVAEAAYVSDANAKLASLDGKIRGLTNRKASLEATNAERAVQSSIERVTESFRNIQIATRDMQTAKDDHARAYREMSALMVDAGAASGMKPRDRQALGGAVEAVPKIEIIIQQLDSIEQGVTLPQYNESSGIGAAMASNASVFTAAIGHVKGNKDYVAELKAVWEARKASVHALVDQSVSVKDTEF